MEKVKINEDLPEDEIRGLLRGLAEDNTVTITKIDLRLKRTGIYRAVIRASRSEPLPTSTHSNPHELVDEAIMEVAHRKAK